MEFARTNLIAVSTENVAGTNPAQTSLLSTANRAAAALNASTRSALEAVQTGRRNGVSHITEFVKSTWDGAAQETNHLSHSVMQNAGDFLTQPVQTWLTEHPLLAWAIDRPLLALGGLVLFVLLFSGLLKAIARSAEQIWYSLLQAPLRLGTWLLSLLPRLFRRSAPAKIVAIDSNRQQERLHDLVAKLEAMRREQDELLKEIKTILATKE